MRKASGVAVPALDPSPRGPAARDEAEERRSDDDMDPCDTRRIGVVGRDRDMAGLGWAGRGQVRCYTETLDLTDKRAALPLSVRATRS